MCGCWWVLGRSCWFLCRKRLSRLACGHCMGGCVVPICKIYTLSLSIPKTIRTICSEGIVLVSTTMAKKMTSTCRHAPRSFVTFGFLGALVTKIRTVRSRVSGCTVSGLSTATQRATTADRE
jgi:hypothetical protein